MVPDGFPVNNIMDADGGNQSRLTDGHDPAWSPDGTAIAFEYGEEVYVINVDGRLTNTAWTAAGRFHSWLSGLVTRNSTRRLHLRLVAAHGWAAGHGLGSYRRPKSRPIRTKQGG